MRSPAAAAALLLALCAGCAAPERYEATVRTPAEGATIVGWIRAFPLLKAVVMSIDGKPRLGWDTQSAEPLLVDPGERVVAVQGVFMGWLGPLPASGHAEVAFTVQLQAGRRYDVRVEEHDHRLTLWLEDAATHAPVTARETREAQVLPVVGGPGGLPH